MVEDFGVQFVVGINYMLERSILILKRDVARDTLFALGLMKDFGIEL